MEIREIRLGNLVGFKYRKDFYGCVTALSLTGGVEIDRFFKEENSDHYQNQAEDNQMESATDISELLLDKFWLERLGFVSAYGSSLQNIKYNFTLNHSGYTIKKMGSYNDLGLFKNGNFVTVCNTVHKLQNLFYDLENHVLTFSDKLDISAVTINELRSASGLSTISVGGNILLKDIVK